jgi:hypothetical protein
MFSKEDRPVGAVRRPPPLQSILRLQRTVGNHAAQRILGIGDGVRVQPTAKASPLETVTAPPRTWRTRLSWTTILAAAGAVPRRLFR